jgi:hypothetical protein
MNNNELKLLIEQGKREQAIKNVKDFYNVSLKEAEEYVDCLVLKGETKIKSEKRKSRIKTILLIAIPIVFASLICVGIYDVQKKSEWNKDVYGPTNYREAYIKNLNDPSLSAFEIMEIDLELRRQESLGIPFKETTYWKNYKLK